MQSLFANRDLSLIYYFVDTMILVMFIRREDFRTNGFRPQALLALGQWNEVNHNLLVIFAEGSVQPIGNGARVC
jgi:hypothetical protein